MGGVNSTVPLSADLSEMGDDSPTPTAGLKLPKSKIIIVLIYSVMSLAIFFNLRVIYIVVSILCKRHPASSRHGGNQHAFVYVLSLSIVDSLVLAHLPLVVTDIVIGWVFGIAVCKLFWIIEQINRILSTFVLMALSGDRYLAVCHPLRFRYWRTTKAAVGVMAISVFVAAVLLTPTYIYSEVRQYPHPLNHTWLKCTFSMDPVMSTEFVIYIFVCGYCIPLISMIFFYGCILRTLWKKNYSAAAAASESTVAEIGQRASRGQKRAQHVTQRALTLVLFYFLCWTPYWAIQFFIEFVLDHEAPPTSLHDVLFMAIYVVHVLTYLNSAVNPFLYALLNRELQQQHSSSTASSVYVSNAQRQQSQTPQQQQAQQRSQEKKPLSPKRNFDNGSEKLISRCFANRRGNVEPDPNEMPLLYTKPARANYSDEQRQNGRRAKLKNDND